MQVREWSLRAVMVHDIALEDILTRHDLICRLARYHPSLDTSSLELVKDPKLIYASRIATPGPLPANML
jgi:hypothetical protein